MVATTLRRGQLAIVQVDSEDSDDPFVGGIQNMSRDTISFVLLTAVGSGTQIFFTDQTWNGTTFSSSGTDGTYTWTAAADYPAGTVITITDAEMAAAGIELADTGEAIYAYQGAANAPTTFLFAVEFGDGNDTFGASLTNTGLTAGNGALAIAEDNVSFGERTWNQQSDVLFQQISDQSNWNTNDNSPQVDQIEGTNLAVAPDVQLWIAGISGGHGLISVNGDASQNGTLGYGVQTYLQNTSSDGNALTSTSRFWDPTHIVFDTVAGKFFVVDSSGTFDRILQGNISDLLTNPGTAPTMTILWSEQPAVSNSTGVTSIALDKTNGDVYFTFSNTLLRVDYNTANQTAVTLANLGNDVDSTNPNYANELILDLANSRAFIVNTETFNDFAEIPPGSGNFIVATTTYQNSILQVANISPSDTNATGNTITELQFNGLYDESLNSATGSPDPGNFEDFYGKITDIDYNTLTNEFWFTTVQLNAGANGETGGIYKATLSGGTLTVTQIYSEGNATNQNFNHIFVDEETGFYYVTSDELDGNSAVYRGSLSAGAGTAPTLWSSLQNINDMTPRDLSVESAPTLAGSAVGGLAVTEASSAANSGETSRVTLFTGLSASDIDTSGGDELAGALVRVSSGFTYEAASTATGHTGTIDYLWINGTTSGTIAGSGSTYSYDQTTGVMTLSGAATVVEYAAALALVQFSTSGDNVTNDGTATSRTIAASVFDGLLYSDEITNTVSVTGINDAPVNTPGVAMNFTEDTTGSTGGTPPVNAITGISIADADADATTDNFTVTLSVAHGTLTIRTDVTGGLAAGDVSGNGTATLTLTGTQTEINTTLAAVNGSLQANGLVYTPAANYNGADTLTIVTNDQGNSGNDPGSTGTGTSEEDSDTKTLNIADVNDAPTVTGDGTEDAATILEDTPQTDLTASSVATLFGGQFADLLDDQDLGGLNPTGSTGDTFAGIAITANGSSGATGQWQFWNGAAWTDIGAASPDAAKTISAATLIRFNPALDYNGAAPTLTVRLIESGGAAITNGATVDLNPEPPTTGASALYTSGTVVLSQNVLSVNDAPTSASLSGDSVTFTEGAANVLLDLGGDATIADVDSANFDGGSLTIGISAGGVSAEDVLAIVNQGVGAGQIGVSGSDVTFAGVTIGTVSGGSGGAALVINFDTDATAAAVQALVRNITYSNTGGEDPTDGDRTISWTLVDGDGTANGGVDTLGFTSTVDVDSVNDEPAGGDETVVLNEDDVHPFSLSDFNFSDTDGDSALEIVLTTLPANGTLLLNSVAITVAGTVVSAADIAGGLLTFAPDADENGAGYATFTFQVRDNGGTDNGGQNTDQTPNTITFDVTALNDAPVLTLQDNTVSGTEDVDVVFNAANLNAITVSDVESATLEVTLTVLNGVLSTSSDSGLTFTTGDGENDATMTFSGTLADINAALEGLVYRGGLNYEGADTLSVVVDDGTDTASGDVTITLADDAIIHGDAGVNDVDGTAGNDYFDVSQGADDVIDGLAGSDRIYYGAAFTAADANDGGADRDVVILQGNYTLTLGPLSLVNVEFLSLQSGSISRWGDTAGNLYSYDITTVQENVLPGQQLAVNGQSLLAGENFTFDGSAETDGGRFLVYGGRGTDDLTGGTGNDIFSFEEPRWNATDTIDGGAGTDAVVLSFGDGLNTIVFGAGQFTSIESISVNNRFATDPSQTPSYALVLDNGNVALGATLIVNGQSLLAGQTISIDGSAVADGRLRLFGGADADVLIGGANDDEMTGKGGADAFTYLSTADSKVALADEILDFEVGIDTIDLELIDAIAGGADDAFTFVGNAAFSSTAGELRAELVGGVWQVGGDTDGNGIADFLILVTTTTADPLGSTDFIL
jgi:hypothetical protein